MNNLQAAANAHLTGEQTLAWADCYNFFSTNGHDKNAADILFVIASQSDFNKALFWARVERSKKEAN